MNEIKVEQNRALEFRSVRHYLDNALSKATHKAYRSDLQHFLTSGGYIPTSAEQIASYLSQYAESLAISTLQRRLVSIGKANAMQGYADPTKTELVKLTFRGIRRCHGRPQNQVRPILKDDLVIMLSHIPDSLKGRRDSALLLVAFCSALRRSELVAIRIEDIEFNAQGLIITVPRSKTDQYGGGRKVAVPKGKGGRVCPVASIKLWMESANITEGPLFRAISKGGTVSQGSVSDKLVPAIIKQYASLSGLDAAYYSGHSTRSGLVTSAAQQGVSSWKIRAQTGHKSDAMLARYVRDSDLFSQNAADLF